MAEQKPVKMSFKETLNLPRTDFPIRANATIDDPHMLERWQQEGLYTKSFYANEGQEKFIFHDGPPYANGHAHLGTAYNKLLKDIATKAQRMFGKQVPITPGWDCHGLPIEWKVAKENPGLSRTELKKKCREFAYEWMQVQREEFKRLGVLMDWDRPYLTMSYAYEAKILEAFGIFVDKGYIERKNKTVPWCPSCQTVLAAAEIEYADRKDPSLFVLFPLEQGAKATVFKQYVEKPVHVLVWTTTPWTLPLNRAVVLKPATTYQLLDIHDSLVIVGKTLADVVCKVLGVEKKVLQEISSDDLKGARVQHPFASDLKVPIILDQSVSLDEGTACVHCAPGCGPEDYEIAVKNNLEVFSPLSVDGKYQLGIVPAELEGMSIVDGQGWVIKKLEEKGILLHKTSIVHSYPHCWRCRGPLMFRATKQWFCNLSRGELKQRTLDAIEGITLLPQAGGNRLQATIEGRLEWCLSRQRTWGVPIAALICANCDYTYVTKELIDRVAAYFAKEGIDYWDQVDPQELLPKNFSCPHCQGTEFKKEQDILDVWFDSGVSHYAVLKENKELGFPADLYLEAKDQTRGWFQSSLLSSMVIEEEPCVKMIVVHGFTVDAQGRKMSKSLGNVVSPQELIEKLGTDGLRLWVSTVAIGGDAVISETLLQNVQEVFRKIRNTCRFLLSNLYDFDLERDAVVFESMPVIDRYALQQLFIANHKIMTAYRAYDFTVVFHTLTDYCAGDLSAFYLDMVKDRLYVEKADGHLRRSAQTVCWYILDTLTRAMAPILSFTAEQLSDHYQRNKTASIHLQRFSHLEPVLHFFAPHAQVGPGQMLAYGPQSEEYLEEIGLNAYFNQQEEQWMLLKKIRAAVLKAIEPLREQGIIKQSLEARVTLALDEKLVGTLQEFFKQLKSGNQDEISFFKEFFIVSQVIIAAQADGLETTEVPGLRVSVDHAHGEKCPRCWQWEVTTHEHQLCNRCATIVKK
jgi:isoleucyl-tRNA synthetase